MELDIGIQEKDQIMKMLNKEQVCYIETYENQKYWKIRYFEEKKFLGFITQKEGFYIIDGNVWQTDWKILKKVPDFVVLKDKIAYRKPYIKMYLSGGEYCEMDFNTPEEMHVFLKREFQGNNWKLIE